MTLSHWTSGSARLEYEAAYEASLALWPIPYHDEFVDTPFGPTHAVISGPTDGPPVILVHAASLSAVQWHAQAAALGQTHRLHAIDIMGDIGLSTQVRSIRTRADASAWLAAVMDGLGLEHATFIGSSFGGFLSTNLAVVRPRLVDALVLLAPAATVKPFKLLPNLAIRIGGFIPLPATVRPGLRGMMSGHLPDERIVHQMETGVRGFRYDRHGIYPSEIEDRDLARITGPTLLLLGDGEMIYDPRAAAARAQRTFPDLRVEVVPDVGHLLGLERPDIVNPRIMSFLETATRVPQVA
jgi:pimeloyl-ACP methyl ester carboxylesterase